MPRGPPHEEKVENMTAQYDPMRSPLELPIRVMRATLHFERPFDLPTVEGASLATSLRGALGHAIRQTTCTALTVCRSGREGCGGAQGCGIPVLWAPESTAQKRQHASPIVLAAPTTVAQGATDVSFRVTLWGRRAIEHQRAAWGALRAAGGRGLDTVGGVLRFEVDLDAEYEGSLDGWARSRGTSLERATLRFAARRDVPAEPARSADRIADIAHDLVQWDLFDQGLDERLGKRGCDELADAARGGVHTLLAAVRIQDRAVIEFGGRRRSGRNEGEFNVPRLAGEVVVEGALDAVIPWLAVIELRGFGPKKAFAVLPELTWDEAAGR